MTDATGKLARWPLELSKLYFEAVHRDGRRVQVTYALFRLLTSAIEQHKTEDDVLVLTITKAQTEGEKSKSGAKFSIGFLKIKVWTP